LGVLIGQLSIRNKDGYGPQNARQVLRCPG
jgi:hypothetical protein